MLSSKHLIEQTSVYLLYMSFRRCVGMKSSKICVTVALQTLYARVTDMAAYKHPRKITPIQNYHLNYSPFRYTILVIAISIRKRDMHMDNMHMLEKAKKKAMNILSARSHCVKELSDKLGKAEFSEDVIADLIEWAIEYRFLDDAEYARRFIETAMAKKHGRKKIERDLVQKGIDRFMAEDVLAEYEFDEAETLRPLVEKRLGGDFSPKSKAKVSRYFAGKGYSFDDISGVIKRVCRDAEEDSF